MFLFVLTSLAVLASLDITEARRYCGDYYSGEYCFPDSNQESYCCGFNDEQCCYDTVVVSLWWFWFIIILTLIGIAIMVILCCRRRRLQQRNGYLIVAGQNFIPGSIVRSNNAQIVHQVTPSGTVYPPYGAVPPYQEHQNQNFGGAAPPPYVLPSAPTEKRI